MKKLILLLALLGLSLATAAQEADGVAAQRSRIKGDRDAAEAVFQSEEKACYLKFAVNDCLKAAKAKRRQVMADLRRQEISLNDAERKRKAAERLRSIEERSSAEPRRREAQAPNDAPRPAKAPLARQAEPRKPKAASEDERSNEEISRSRKRHEERLAQAAERRAKLEKRLAERKKPAAAPLPAQP